MALIDTHAHLTSPEYDTDLDAVLSRAGAGGVDGIVVVGFDLGTSRQAVDLAGRYQGMVAAVGMHPNEALYLEPGEQGALAELAAAPAVAAIGETGLDYYRNRAPRDVQMGAFCWHLELAQRCSLPVIVHDREAHADVLRALQDHAVDGQVRGVMHCFSGGDDLLEAVLTLGMYVSLGGPVTYPNARRPLEIARRVPLDRLLLETDCPWLTPAPHRGERNEPAHLPYVARRIAEVRGLSEEELAAATSANARTLFQWPDGENKRLAGMSGPSYLQDVGGNADASAK